MNLLMTMWVINIVAESAVLAAILRRREATRYKTFAAFVAFYVVRSLITLYCAHVSAELWARAYFVGRTVRVPLVLMVMVELFYWTVRPRGIITFRKSSMFLFCFSTLAIVSYGLADADPSSHPDVVIAAIRTMDRSVDFVMFGVILLVFVVGRAWRIYDVRERGIALGFFVWLAIDLAVEFAEYHSVIVPTSPVFRAVSLCAFLAGAIIWLIHFLLPQPEFSRFGEPEYHEAQRWMDSMRGVVGDHQ